jgi:uroporphyrinogen-III synthase
VKRVIVTRPQREAQQWVHQLSRLGFEAFAFPLIEIRAAAQGVAVQSAWSGIAGFHAVMFVSGNAVEAFWSARPQAMEINALPRAWATGPGTREALVTAGWPGENIDAPDSGAPQFDSEALWELVGPSVDGTSRVLIVRGSDAGGTQLGRGWFAGQLAAAGADVQTVVAYERHVPQPDVQQIAIAANACRDGSVWLFSSSQAVSHLGVLMPGQDWSQARAVATHPRIAQAAREAGFGVVCESRPALADVVRSIESAG